MMPLLVLPIGHPPVYGTQEKGNLSAGMKVALPQAGQTLRVVKTSERKAPVRRQLDRTVEIETTPWYWMTTLSPHRAKSRVVVSLGHSRWCLENEGFNELATRQYTDHVYKHDPSAILNF